MNSLLYEIVTCLLSLTVVRGISVPAEQNIYVDKVNRTLDPCCWEYKSECSSVEVNCRWYGIAQFYSRGSEAQM